MVKDADGIREEVYRAGTPDGSVAARPLRAYLKKAIEFLEKARAVADPAQATVIADLIRFYQTGDPKDWLQFGADWVRNDATVDFANGFIEVYRDARGAKGSSQSFVTDHRPPVTDAMTKLARERGAIREGGAVGPEVQEAGVPAARRQGGRGADRDRRLPRHDDRRQPAERKRDSREIRHEEFPVPRAAAMRSVRASASIARRVRGVARGSAARRKYGEEAEDLLTAMHEVIGHGSGKLSERLKGGAEPYLKEYYSTLEEARADLMALWNVWDPKLKKLGSSAIRKTSRARCTTTPARVALTQLRRIPTGNTIEEDHAARPRVDRQLHQGQDRRHRADHAQRQDVRSRQGLPEDARGRRHAAAELMRIKAEGDYDAIKALVDKYGVHFDPALRDEVVARYKQLDLPTHWAGINAELTAQLDARARSRASTSPIRATR